MTLLFILVPQLVSMFLILGTFIPAAKLFQSQCEQCLVTTRHGNQVTRTLVYHSHYDCQDSNNTFCVHNTTTYEICPNNGNPICFNPQGSRFILNIEVTGYRGSKKSGVSLGRNQSTSQNPQVQICFDACYAIECGSLDWHKSYCTLEKYLYEFCNNPPAISYGVSSQSYTYWHTKKSQPRPGPPLSGCYGSSFFNISWGEATSTCHLYKCNPMCLLFNAPPPGTLNVGLGINRRGTDPFGQIEIKVTRTVHQPERFTIFHSFYEEMEKKVEIPPITKNLFIDLAERIASSLNVTNCYTDPEILQTSIIGDICFQRPVSRLFTIPLGDLVCQNLIVAANASTTWWSGVNATQPTNPFSEYKQLSSLWDRLHDASSSWPAPDGLFWICGRKAYVSLPRKWSGTCALGTVKPSFFLLPITQGERLGVPVYDEVGHRDKRSVTFGDLKITDQKTWHDEDWPPERIIQVYGPATWAEDGMWGYRTPIYLLNRLIRLQAIVELITNTTSTSLTLLAQTNTKIRTAVYQNRLALDYLLAQEGGVCGKFNLTNCCLEIDDNGKVIEELTARMRKLAHVPVQKWTGAVDFNWFGSIFSDWKRIGFMVLLAFGSLLFLPCLIPLIQKIVTSTISGITVLASSVPTSSRQKPANLMILKTIPTKYVPLLQHDGKHSIV
ncbi:endogenous retrovirus group 3 member 1 Env polyprotein-like [Pituophis catenifer annectens]|uniref:endogenous retrovirus group 3 member 1 Env polyprotein-like n=1 Tax=Pituophis catenifer annectens TaxID=94852 RepID=UPI0039935EE9